MTEAKSEIVHANCVSVDGDGLLIYGRSGAGKSTLSLELMGLGAMLVSDDRTVLSVSKHGLQAEAPAPIQGLIEARGVGILTVPAASPATVKAVVDLDQVESERLPKFRNVEIMGVLLPHFHKVESAAFPTSLLYYIKYGRQDDL